METQPENFGQFVQQKRLERGLTQKQLASKVSCSVDTIRAIEQNRSNYVPSGQMVTALAQALEASEDELRSYLKAKENVVYVPPRRQPNYVLLATSVLIAAVLITAAFFILTSLPQRMVGAIFAPALAQTPISVKTPTPTLVPTTALTGGWIAENYMCGGKYYTEKVRLELQGANYIVATKIDGDVCVSAGEKTWEGTYNNPANTYPFSFPVKLWIKDAHGQMTTVDSEAVMVNPYQIDIDSGTYVITFKNSVAPTPTSKAVPDVVVEEPNVVPNWVTNEPKCDGTWNGWYRFQNSNGFFNYLASNVQTADQPANSATWRPTLPIAGRWRVEMYNLMHHYYPWPCVGHKLANDTGHAVYEIYYAVGKAEVVIDQQTEGNAWLNLGTYRFSAGSDDYVLLNNVTGEREKSGELYVLFSAIRFVYVGP